MPKKQDEPLLSPQFALALQFANEIHITQARKGLGAPYISHLMAVSALVLEFGGNETQAIAALLHDSAEDCGGRTMLDEVRGKFGDEVASIVEACTDTFENPKPRWGPRKKRYLQATRNKSPVAKLVACADKLHNLSNTLRDIEQIGAASWIAQMAKTENNTAEKQCWYYVGCLEALADHWDAPILKVFERAVEEICSLCGTTRSAARQYDPAWD